MISNGKTFSLLKRLGLNQYESKVYLGLLSKGISSAGEVSDISGVPRSRAYDVLSSLEKRGFLKVQNDRPVRYIPSSPEEVMRRIKSDHQGDFEKKLTDLEKLEKEFVEALNPIYNSTYSSLDPTSLTGFIKGDENMRRQKEEMILSAEKSICKITSGDGMKNFVDNHANHVKEANAKGVEIRVLANIEERHRDPAKNLENHGTVRKTDISTRILVKDKKEALLIMSPDSTEQEYGVWVKSPHFVNNLQDLFDHHWERGVDLN
ncbi:TrmB family transcriptional regulator [Candidatus Undinarchaeota archaeon]